MIGAPLMFGACAREAAFGFAGLTAPGIPPPPPWVLFVPSCEEPEPIVLGAGLDGEKG
jgi:hypothetical protein